MIRALVAFAACILPLPALAQTVTEGRIRADTPGPVISRNIYGQFSEHLGRGVYEGIWVGPNSPIPNTRGIRKDVVEALKAIKVPVVRWPGGCFADEYHWRDGIGPAAKRPVRKNNWWDSVESNAFGTHEFFDFAEQIGAGAYVSINVASSNVSGSNISPPRVKTPSPTNAAPMAGISRSMCPSLASAMKAGAAAAI
jgi:alpha-L-arabinofuranosidase